jgi:dTDP-glucose 4,6-dehydratase
MAASNETVLVTGVAGFIGFYAARHALAAGARVLGVDHLGPVAVVRNVEDLVAEGMTFRRLDVRDTTALSAWMRTERVDCVLHLAAESHNDRAILDPMSFVSTNVEGTASVLEAARHAGVRRVVVVSTIEVYGSQADGAPAFHEGSSIDARTPYAASKGAADVLTRAWARTYPALEVVLTHAANNLGPRQLPEKLIPRAILEVLAGRPIPLYGDGRYARDWLAVEDHVDGLWRAAHAPVASGEAAVVDFSAREVWTNEAIARGILARLGRPAEGNLAWVTDRPNHDRVYAIDPAHAEAWLGWRARTPVEQALAATVDWYVANEAWWRPLLGRALAVDWAERRVPGRG